MAGSSFGTILRVTTFGESHGPAIGAVLDGFPAGMPLCEGDIQAYLDRRKPGQSAVTTQRKESDTVEILSGVFEGRTTGTPISLLIRNADQHSKDYGNIADTYRPGHADYTFDQKYGFRDYRGGGRSSGRETACRVAAGAIAEKFLKDVLGIDLCFYTKSIGDVEMDPANFDRSLILSTPTGMPDAEANEKAMALVEACRMKLDSVGGVVEGRIAGVPAGIGDTVFEKLDARLAHALFSIGAVKEVGIGDGAAVSRRRGSENNDDFYLADSGSVEKRSNHAGGILGGMSDGSDIVVRAYFKPTPSIAQPQETITRDGKSTMLEIHGRHDPVIVPRAIVVCETMCALTLLDAMLVNMSARADSVARFYQRS